MKRDSVTGCDRLFSISATRKRTTTLNRNTLSHPGTLTQKRPEYVARLALA
jgi:hypothetical protein